ncbi:LON peptidase substrate-binding domain-containing protein [Sphingomonas sp. KRR8]|uniref:LON peptidase substrate-binding domain-containing protein n=1 Tax=Sphingomonas sp. KRR8 TaxID=2942996 RepID=UPI0020201993|nr:LON peptidase substrate-binding domain-containing protein [Sphingomonas sp. KRR8]URD60183.1 LON peptidase substrate-binding domain-containing protein [Sphingomonas sp. KRR8]
MSGTSLRIPLFPIGGAILFPRSQLPLHVFEPRYRTMIEDASAGAARIGMIQPLGTGDDPQHPPLYRVGCVGEIVGLEELDDGRFNLVLQGSTRFRLIAEADVGTPYRQADVDEGAFDDSDPDPLGLAQRSEVEREARRLGDAMGLTVDWSAVGRLDDEMLVNAIAQVAPFDVGAKQALLEAATLPERADLLVQLMQFLRLAVGGGEQSPRLQ